MEIANLSALFKAIGEPVRLRILHLLATAELSVGELVRILDLPQSTVSRHLKALKERGLAADRPVGAAAYYRAAIEADSGNGDAALRDALVGVLKGSGLPPADRKRLDKVLALREQEGGDFFDKLGLRWDALREDCFGQTFHLEALIHLLPREWTVADLGTGTGYLLPALGAHFRRVIGVDASQPMLELARHRLNDVAQASSLHAKAGKMPAPLRNVELRHGTLEKLPMKGCEADLALALLMLHHLPEIEAALREIHRVLKPGGRLLIVEIRPYENERFRTAMGDRRAGVDPKKLEGWLKAAGFKEIEKWEFTAPDRPEHELEPLPGIYGMIAAMSR